MRRARAPAIAIALTALCLVPGAAVAATGSVYGSPAVNRAHALRAVTRLVGQLRPGPGATRSAHAPDGRLAVSPLRMADRDLVNAHRWFETERSPEAVLRFVTAHLPPGAERHQGGSSGGSNGVVELDWPLPPVPGVPTREVAVSVAPLPGGRTAVRLDAAAVWLTPRPAWERVPRGVTSVTFAGTAALDSPSPGRRSRPVTVTGVRARRLAALVNSFPRVQPAVASCPFGDGTRLTLTFRGPHHGPLARARYVDEGCPTVGLRVGGRTGPPLADATLGDPPRTVIGDIVADHLVPACRAGQLSLAATVSIPPNEDGSIDFTIVNRSDDLCTVGGVPRVTLQTASGHALATHELVAHATAHNPPSLVFPGGEALFDATFQPCPEGPAVQAARVRLPHARGALTATMGLIDPCLDQISVEGVFAAP